MDLDEIKRGLRAEIKKRENEQYATFQCNVRQMCKDVLAKLEDQESELAEKDKKIAELKEQYKDMDVTHTVHIAKMNAKIEELEELEENHKKEVERLLMKIACLEKLVETADKFVKQKGGFTVKDIKFNGVKLEGMKND